MAQHTESLEGLDASGVLGGRRATGLRAFLTSLPGRLLAYTAGFVLLAEVLVFVPSMSQYRLDWLSERVAAAQIAALAVEAAPETGLSDSLRAELLRNAEVRIVALQRDGERVLHLAAPSHGQELVGVRLVDLRSPKPVSNAVEAMRILIEKDGRPLRVIAAPRYESGEYIEVVMNPGPLRRDMRAYAGRVAANSLMVSLATGALVYLTLLFAIVRPIRRLTKQIERFARRPLDPDSTLKPSGRGDEIGRAEVAFAEMETQVRLGLQQRSRLAALGEAVAKIAHDLRNSLATAQLVSDRLAASDDPQVRQVAPRLERALTRASNLAQATLQYGKADEAVPELAPLDVAAALDEAAAEAMAMTPQIIWRNAAPAGLIVQADADELHRVFANLLRNAAQALSAQNRTAEVGAGTIAATASAVGGDVLVRIVDDGPGLPKAVEARLFEPFSASGKPGGAGLGLAIARERARAQGGEVALVMTGPQGTAFEVRLKRG
jgi:signal transduction histidine kinase